MKDTKFRREAMMILSQASFGLTAVVITVDIATIASSGVVTRLVNFVV
jgi:hypothetical protein